MPLHWVCSNGGVKKCTTVLQTQFSFLRRFLSENHYDTLKLPPSCTTKEIREAFISLTKKNHPDKHIGDPSMHDRFIKINEAYTVLINPVSRRIYDVNLKNDKKLKPPSSMRHSTKTTVTYSSAFDSPFMWDNRDKRQDFKYKDKPYYGIEGIKKVSNTAVLMFVLLCTLFGIALQVLAIRSSFIRSRDQMLETSRKNSMLHSIAREKAKLYGKDHQIELLKKSLRATCEIPEEEVELPPDEPNDYPQFCDKCNGIKL